MKKLPKFPEPSEFEIQRNIFTWAAILEKEYPQLKYLNGSLNGVRLTPGLAKKMVQIGLRAGYPDVNLPWPCNGYHGLYIELKRKTRSTTTDEQRDWIRYLTQAGYFALYVKGESAAKSIILSYLKGEFKNKSS